jgi:hypothetical protein
MYYEKVPATTKPEKEGEYIVIDKYGCVSILKWTGEIVWRYPSGGIVRDLDEYTHYLRPVEPSPDVAAAAREYADSGWKDMDGTPIVDDELEKAFLSGHTHAMMSKPQVNASMDFREMFTRLFDTSFLAPDELQTVIYAAEKYALAKCREAEQEVREYREALGSIEGCENGCQPCRNIASHMLIKYKKK